MKCLVVVSGAEQTEQDRRLIGLAAWMGVPVRSVVIQGGESTGQRLLDELKPPSGALALSIRTLAILQKSFRAPTGVWPFLKSACTELLVFGFGGSAEESTVISGLAEGEVSGVSRIDKPEITISFPEHAKAYNRQLAGLNYVRRGGEPLSVFALQMQPGGAPMIVAADDHPMFLRMESEGLPVFLLGGPSLPDLDQPLSREYEVKEHYERLLPAFMFLRHCFGETCWHNPRPTARLILDDPLLTPRYGFLDYNVLLESMRLRNYGTSIAFIPWNCWRTSRRDVERLLGNPHLSLCIHGCDHANREFETQDSALLDKKAALALQRMDSLRRRTGAEIEEVMVFPQERYSAAAIEALRRQPYLAIVNTICAPLNSEPDDLRIRDFLAPAITRYHGFPIFQRRYPRRLIDFACDLFLGKPALAVEHHDYFQNGIAPLEDFIAALHHIEPGLRWPDLNAQLAECCLWRRIPKEAAEVRFFTRRFRLTPRDGGAALHRLSKHEPEASRIAAVLVDRKPVDVAFDGEFLEFEVETEPGQTREIEIVDRREQDALVRSFGIRHNARVLVRRTLSEFRDNTLSRHSGLKQAAQWVADQLNITGAGYDDTERYEAYEHGCVKPPSHPDPGDPPSLVPKPEASKR